MTMVLSCMVFGFSASAVFAQGAVSGDEVCGKIVNGVPDICNPIEDGKTIIGNLITGVLPVVMALLVVFIILRVLWGVKLMMIDGNPSAMVEARKQIWSSLVGFVVLVLLLGGAGVAILTFLGTQDWAIQLLKLFSEAIVPHAYAVEGRLLPNPLGTNNLYDFVLLFVRLVVRWFVFPALIVMWVWSGFAYVLAQGNPEKISTAHKWLLWAVISTVVVMVTEGFLFALQGTVQQILS